MDIILTPVGRMVMGSVYEPKKVDMYNKPLTTKLGQPRVDYFFALAIAKGSEVGWRDTDWGRIIVNAANNFFKAGQTSLPNFAWKVVDGDSTVPNQKGVAPNTREGYRGSWVLTFTGGFAPSLVDTYGEYLTTPNAIKCGDYIQVRGAVVPNSKDPITRVNPGLFLNHTHVAFVGHGDKIEMRKDSIDPKTIPFSHELPQGATVGRAFTTPQPPAANAPSVNAPPPYPEILTPVKQHIMLPAANGVSYEDYIANKWTDELLIAHGMMAA